jgi:cytochrome c peroxidase
MRIQLFSFLLFLSFFSCTSEKKESSLPEYNPHFIEWNDPKDFVKMVIPEDNPLTEEGVALGKRLFFDTILSKDESISCASCHDPVLAFTDGQAKSIGFKEQLSKRSSMSLLNVGYHHSGFFWDGRAKTLEEQALEPVENPLEMASDWTIVENRLQKHKEYPALFAKAFGIQEANDITRQLAAKALAQYERTLVSADAKFDRVMRKEESFTEAEQRGWTIFFDASQDLPDAECAHCHIDPLFTTLEYLNNGLDRAEDLETFEDLGRGGVLGNKYYNGTFKVPSLRNIALTAPYMHDGRFETLEEVIEHYNSGGHYAVNVSPNVRKLNLNEQNKKDLIAFLYTLTDYSLLKDKN